MTSILVHQFEAKVVLDSELDSKSDSRERKKKGLHKNQDVSSGCNVTEEAE
jgi:hypothetical protein